MLKETILIVWSYMSCLNVYEEGKLKKYIICFSTNDLNYSGNSLGCSDSVWIVPGTVNVDD